MAGKVQIIKLQMRESCGQLFQSDLRHSSAPYSNELIQQYLYTRDAQSVHPVAIFGAVPSVWRLWRFIHKLLEIHLCSKKLW
jgi:hypothetical protein